MTVPVSVRWNKWRMWRQKDGSWLAQQPFQIKDPMFKHRSNAGEEWPVFSYKHRDGSRVLHEMQLAMAKAAAHPDGPRVEFLTPGGAELKVGSKVKVNFGAYTDSEGVVTEVNKTAHLRSRFGSETGYLPIYVRSTSGLTHMWYGPDDLEVIE